MKPVASLCLLVASATAILVAYPRAHAESRPIPVPHPDFRPNQVFEDISFHEARVKRDPKGAIGLRQLASAYLAAARQGDNAEFAVKSENTARRSLAIRKTSNAGAAIVLADSLLEQHRFAEAKEACELALKLEPGADAAMRTMTDIHFELGEYDQANQLVAGNKEWAKDPNGQALLARKSELYGQINEARSLLSSAVDLAEADYEMSPSAISWFHTRLGDFEARNGNLEKAGQQYSAALKLVPSSWKALAGMARLAALQGNDQAVLDFGKKLCEIAPMTDAVGLMEDSAKNLNKKTLADHNAAQVLELNKSTITAGTGPHSEQDKGHTHDRMFCLYLANHGKMLDLAQHAATHELAARKDLYSYDTYGWVTYLWAKSRGDRASIVEAKQALDKALATGSLDARLWYHSGVVAFELGQMSEAKEKLAKALELNSHFEKAWVEDAQAKLSGL